MPRILLPPDPFICCLSAIGRPITTHELCITVTAVHILHRSAFRKEEWQKAKNATVEKRLDSHFQGTHTTASSVSCTLSSEVNTGSRPFQRYIHLRYFILEQILDYFIHLWQTMKCFCDDLAFARTRFWRSIRLTFFNLCIITIYIFLEYVIFLHAFLVFIENGEYKGCKEGEQHLAFFGLGSG